MSLIDYITHPVKNLSLRRKLLLVIWFTTSMAMLLASLAVIVYDRQTAKNTLKQEIGVLSNVIAQRSSAALTFQDRQLAEDNLHALKEKPTVNSACIYNRTGELFGTYHDVQQAFCSPTEPPQAGGFTQDAYIAKQDILVDGVKIGSLVVNTSLDEINQRLIRFVLIVTAIFVAAGGIAFLLAVKLQKIITHPIDELAEASRRIGKDNNFTLRVNKVTNDEIGDLVTAFNEMLEGIEDRDAMLVEAKKNLEEIVRERTAELRNAQDELIRKDRMATLGQLTATVSHELRNPLGTIRTSVFTLSNRIREKDDSIKNVIARIDRNIVRCDSIITELLDYSRIRALQHQKTRVADWVNSLLDDLNLPDDVSLVLDVDETIEIEIDRDLLRRVLINVFDNAAQAMSDMGPAHDKKIIVECRLNQERTEIIVTDTGPGIPEDVFPHIFEPLFSTRSFGVGLGLPVVRQIMVQHGGNVEISSEATIGTRVVLWLPVTLAVNGRSETIQSTQVKHVG